MSDGSYYYDKGAIRRRRIEKLVKTDDGEEKHVTLGNWVASVNQDLVDPDGAGQLIADALNVYHPARQVD